MLKKLKATLDFDNNLLITPNATIPVHISGIPNNKIKATHNFQNFELIIEPRVEKFIQLPVKSNRTFGILNKITLHPGVEIPSSIVKINNGFATTSVINSSEKTIKIKINEPLDIENFEEIQCNNLSNTECEQEPMEIDENFEFMQRENLNNIRMEHMNAEEQLAIQEMCSEFKDIFRDRDPINIYQ